jgi:hypothetical protein
VADPPKGWTPGTYGIEYDFGHVSWTQHGTHAYAPGNWHTGDVTVEEDDDGITGPVTDWTCPRGDTPPAYPWSQTPSKCKVARYQWIDTTGQPIGVDGLSSFDQRKNQLIVRGDFWAWDMNDNRNGTVHLDLVFQAVGSPVVRKDVYGTAPDELLDYSESWSKANVWGRVNGLRVNGPGTTQLCDGISFQDSGWVRAG